MPETARLGSKAPITLTFGILSLNTALSDALAPLSKRMPRAVRDIEILRVSAQLDGEDYAASAEAARKEALKWAKKRAGRALPKAAWDLQDFDLPVGGRSSTAVRIENDALDLWALRAEDPDKDVAGRVWSTEIVIGGEVGSRPHVSLRLIVSTTEPDLTIDPHVPGPVSQMIEAPGLIRGARQLFSEPVTIQKENDAEDLCDYLEDGERRLPIFVVAMPEGGGKPHINIAVLAKAVAGLARIVLVPAELTWVLTKRFGKYRSVFNAGIRAYLRGFPQLTTHSAIACFWKPTCAKPVAGPPVFAVCVHWQPRSASRKRVWAKMCLILRQFVPPAEDFVRPIFLIKPRRMRIF